MLNQNYNYNETIAFSAMKFASLQSYPEQKISLEELSEFKNTCPVTFTAFEISASVQLERQQAAPRNSVTGNKQTWEKTHPNIVPAEGANRGSGG